MEKVKTLEYKGFKTDIFVLDCVKNFFKENNLDLTSFLEEKKLFDDFSWYEHKLFPALDPVKWYEEKTSTWNEEDEKRKQFKLVFYGVIEKWDKGIKYGFEEEFDFFPERILGDSHYIIHNKNIGIKFKLFVE